MNKIRVYNSEEIRSLIRNPNVKEIKNKSQIVYKNEFKLWAIKEKLNHPEKTARQIFVDGGFDMNILDERTPQRRLCSWIKKYKMFGEDYFTNKNQYTYKATLKNKNKYLNKIINESNFVALVIAKKEDGSFDYKLIRKNKDEKINY